MRYWTLVVIFFATATLAACGGSSSNGGDDSGGGGGSGSGNFSVSGQLPSGTYSISPSLQKADADSITHVCATSTETANAERVCDEVDSDGSFELALNGERIWIVCAIDSNEVGPDMLIACLKTSDVSATDDLDTLPINEETGELDFGELNIDADSQVATSDIELADLLSALDLEQDTAEDIAGQDEIGLRYQNPDIDEDGEIDADQDNRNYMLDFHVRFSMDISGTQATMNDIIDSFLDSDTTTATYLHTGIYVAYPSAFSSATSGSVTFVDSAVTTDEGGSIPANTPTSDITVNAFGDYLGFGPNISQTSELPSGTIIFAMGDEQLTFTGVRTPTLAELNAPTGRIFPFIRFNQTSSACTTDCTLSGVSYKWMKKTASGWAEASLAELTSIADSDGGAISIYVNGDDEKRFMITIPITEISGTIDWVADNATLEGGLTAAEFEDTYTSELCHLGLSYDDKLGMRYFQNFEDSGSCDGS